jgi:hypothetical protein
MAFKIYYLSDFDCLPLELDIRAGHFKMRWAYDSYEDWESSWFCGFEEEAKQHWSKLFKAFPDLQELGYRAVVYPISRLPVLIEPEPKKEFFPNAN